MPTLVELRSRLAKERDPLSAMSSSDEALVADVRGRLTPAQMVDQKLRRLLRKGKAFNKLPAHGVGSAVRAS